MSSEIDIEDFSIEGNGERWDVRLVIARPPDLRARIELTHLSSDGLIDTKALFQQAVGQAIAALQALQK